MSTEPQFNIHVKQRNLDHKYTDGRDSTMKGIIEYIAPRVLSNNKRPLILKAGTGLGKSTSFIYQLAQRFPKHLIVCS